jgi:hypothetical protein
MLAYVSQFLGSGLAIRFARGKGGDMTGSGQLELRQQSAPYVAARMTTETNRDMDIPVPHDTDTGVRGNVPAMRIHEEGPLLS